MESGRRKASIRFRAFLNSLAIKPVTETAMLSSIKTFWEFLDEHNWSLPIDSMTTIAEFEAWMEVTEFMT